MNYMARQEARRLAQPRKRRNSEEKKADHASAGTVQEAEGAVEQRAGPEADPSEGKRAVKA